MRFSIIWPFLLWSMAIFHLAACNGPKKQEHSPGVKKHPDLQLVRFDQPVNGSMFAQGEAVMLSLRVVADTVKPDSVLLYADSRFLAKLDELTYSMETQTLPLGSRRIRATAWYNGERQTVSVGIRIKAGKSPRTMNYRVVNTFPHDKEAYTQGLFYHNGYLIESTGQKGMSTLRRVEIKTGKVVQSVNLDQNYFGEGATLYKDEIYQLTWTSRKGFVYNPQTFSLIRTFEYLTQGWGITTMHDTLIMSDGSNVLYFLEPKSFTELRRVEVCDSNGPVSQLNELEYIQGKVYANIYQTDRIVIINPSSGMVEAQVDFSNLLKLSDRHRNIDVFNGIAWDEENQRLFVTGKNWPKLFQVEIF
ncbi:MAG TPA: glutaminyl-peptide cyclotransferase [Tenuifilaceae bacterium]|nr:glutaminyl-peptide cyclotransferase [Tenuifilaceae bacterium]